MSEKIRVVSDHDFEHEVLQSNIPVAVDFWAEWCGPCRNFAPIFEETAEDYLNKIKFCKLNVDENDQIPLKFGVRGIPTIIVFKNGTIEARKIGALTKSQLKAFLDGLL